MDTWKGHPSWLKRGSVILSTPIPDLPKEDWILWKKALEVADLNDLYLITDQFKGVCFCFMKVSNQSMAARARYRFLTSLSSQEKWPLLLILLSECHYLMHDVYGAFLLAKQAQAIIEVNADVVLDCAIIHLESKNILFYRPLPI